MKNLKLILITALICNIHLTGTAQKKKADQKFAAVLKGIAAISPNKISLRWNISEYSKMKYLAANGVVIDRLILDANDKAKRDWERITPMPFKAISKADIDKQNSKTDTGLAVINKCLYDATPLPKTNFLEAVQNQDMAEQNKYYVLALYASKSPKTAIAAGLGYDDVLTTDSTKAYVYRVSLANNDANIAPAFIYITGKALNEKPTIDNITTNAGDKRITINWGKSENSFAGYFIERSKNGKDFVRLNEALYASSTDTTNVKQTFTDSVANYTKYFYRIVGMNYFGAYTTSNAVEAPMAKDLTPPYEPFLKGELKDNIINLNWKIPIDKDLKGFYILYSKKNNGSDSLVSKEMVTAKTNTFKLAKPANFKFGYYRVMAVDTAGNYSLSNPIYLFVTDNIPPKPPLGLQAKIDTNGVAKLYWPLDTTDAIMGYKVFFANQDNHEFMAVSNIIDSLNFTYQVQTKTLSPFIYFKIVAVDQNYNHSNFSEVIKLKRPDKVPPSEPIIQDYKVIDKSVTLIWSPVKDEDEINYIVLRRLPDAKTWQTISTTKQTIFTDTSASANTIWEYSVQAIDAANLKSSTAFPLSVKTGIIAKKEYLKPLKQVDKANDKITNLTWQKSKFTVKRVLIYRKVNTDYINTTSVTGDKLIYVIKSSEVNNKFAIKFLYDDNTESDIFYE